MCTAYLWGQDENTAQVLELHPLSLFTKTSVGSLDLREADQALHEDSVCLLGAGSTLLASQHLCCHLLEEFALLHLICIRNGLRM